MNDYFEKLQETLSKISIKNKSSWIFILCFIFGIIFLVRSCSQPKSYHQTIFVVARDSGWHSLQLFGKDKNLIAFTNELMLLITSETHLHFRWLETGANTLIEKLNDGECDGILSTLHPSPYNRDTYLFSDIILATGSVLVVRQDSPVQSFQELQGQVIGYSSNTSLIYNKTFQTNANAYNILLINYVSGNQALEALANKQLDGVVLEAFTAYTLTETQYAGILKVANRPITDEGLRLITLYSEELEVAVKEFDKALIKIKNDGLYDKLIDKWDLYDAETRYQPKQ